MSQVLAEWEAVGLVHRYAAGDDPERVYGHVLTWAEHQRERDSKPKYPEPPCGGLPPLAAKCGESRLARARSESRESLTTESRESSSTGSWPSPAALVALYNAESPPESPAVTTLSTARREKAARYLRAFPDESWWREVFRQMHRSKFLRGLTAPRDGRKAFVADFDWLLTKGRDGTENVVKVADGRYQDG